MQNNERLLHIHSTVKKDFYLSYLLQFPNGYEAESEKNWPLILYLHGMGERGDSLNLLKKHGIPKVYNRQDLPCIALSPLCPVNTMWILIIDQLFALLDEIISHYPIDQDRIYGTGLSMGGFGTWALADANPSAFAAIAPICGGADRRIGFPGRIAHIGNLPVWAFHGQLDETVPPQESVVLVEALKKAGGDAKLTLYPHLGHDCWTETYDNPLFYQWLFSKRKSQRSVIIQ